ncbi:MAG: sigma-70 family RNA polymerase sigma factor [Polyangiaceae bacterium]|nr:sigma-70 family RNA polymerase sigma factor [Polyangiaceae bacterium]
MARFQGGDRGAFTVLMKRHLGGIYNFVARHTSVAVAEDLSQEVFLRVVERNSAFKHEAKFTTWLYAIARNLCVDTLRKMAHRRHPSLDEPLPGGGSLGDTVRDEHPSASAERMAAGREAAGTVTSTLEAMPEEQREVFLLREVGGLPFAEIAKVTGVPENTVKSRMRYALERLRGGLDGDGGAS